MGVSDDPETTPVTFNLDSGSFTTSKPGSGVSPRLRNSTDQPVGEAPPEEGAETKLSEVVTEQSGGVLSDRGELVLEPSLRFTHSTSNRAFVTGIEIQDLVFIGLDQCDEADRDFVEAALTVRYGITDRFEVETRVPYLFRQKP